MKATEVCMVRLESRTMMNTIVRKRVVASYQASESYCQSCLDVPPSPWPSQLIPVLYCPLSRKIRVSGNCPSGSALARRPLVPILCPYALPSLRCTGKGPGTILLATPHVVTISPQSTRSGAERSVCWGRHGRELTVFTRSPILLLLAACTR